MAFIVSNDMKIAKMLSSVSYVCCISVRTHRGICHCLHFIKTTLSKIGAYCISLSFLAACGIPFQVLPDYLEGAEQVCVLNELKIMKKGYS